MLYEFQCLNCKKIYEELIKIFDPTGKYEGIVCPDCSSKRKIKLISTVKHTFKNPEGTGKMASHDYAYNHSLDKPGGARDQRKMAEELSHMGKTPYNNIDDISSGKHFGEVK